MKKFLVLLSVVLSILCLGSAALAEGFSAGADYTILSDDSGADLGLLTIGGEYAIGSFFVGGWYGRAVADRETGYYDERCINYCFYDGYYLLDLASFRLAAVNAALVWHDIIDYYDNEEETDYASLLVGLNGSLRLGAFEAAFLYLYGIYTTSTGYVGNEWAYKYKDLDACYLEARCAYQFSDSLGAFLVYKSIAFSGDGADEEEQSGLGLGLKYKF